jgi:hypothetical protein
MCILPNRKVYAETDWIILLNLIKRAYSSFSVSSSPLNSKLSSAGGLPS